MLWHYTMGNCLRWIIKTGALIPYGGNELAPLFPGEKPAVWFSTEQFWEPTAQKGDMGMLGTHEKCGGLSSKSITVENGHPCHRFQ
jgi:hypothetical protein